MSEVVELKAEAWSPSRKYCHTVFGMRNMAEEFLLWILDKYTLHSMTYEPVIAVWNRYCEGTHEVPELWVEAPWGTEEVPTSTLSGVNSHGFHTTRTLPNKGKPWADKLRYHVGDAHSTFVRGIQRNSIHGSHPQIFSCRTVHYKFQLVL